jgi:integrase
MPSMMLSDKMVKNAKSEDGRRTMIWDSAISGDASLPGSFGLRVTGNGVKSWIIMFRIDSKQQYRKIAGYPAVSLSEARNLARKALMSVGQGIDPIKAKAAEKRKIAGIKTVGEAVEIFIERHVKKKNRSWQEVERVFNVYILPKLGDRALPTVGPGDVHELLDELIDAGHPYMANRLFAHTRKFFNWCAERHWINEPPTKNIKRPADEEARDRILENDEIRLFWTACDDLGWPFGPFLKLLLLTGQRRNEVAGMKWLDIDFDKAVWTLPKEATKSKRKHEVPLSSSVMALIQTGSQTGEYVFSTTGKTPVSGFSKAKLRLDAAITELLVGQGDDEALPAWRFHDLRRTAASGMAEIGIAPHVIEKVLNHSTGQISGVAAVYNRHAYRKEMSEALNAWARAIELLTSPNDDNVIELRK